MPRACTHCGYDLRGIESSICPECGKPIARQQGSGTAIAEMAAHINDVMQSQALAPPVVAAPRPRPEMAPPAQLPVTIWLLIGVAAVCMLILALMLVQQWSDDNGWLLGLTLAPAGLAAAFYVARR